MSPSKQSSKSLELSVVEPVGQGQVITCPCIVLAVRHLRAAAVPCCIMVSPRPSALAGTPRDSPLPSTSF